MRIDTQAYAASLPSFVVLVIFLSMIALWSGIGTGRI